MHLADRFITECKEYITNGDIATLKEYEASYSSDGRLAWDYILMKLYIHACLKKQKEIATWLLSLTERLDPIQKVAIRSGISYGKRLLA